MITRHRSENGLEWIRISNEAAEGELYLQGAHLTSWKPMGHEQVIWLSEKSFYEHGKAIRGGVPLCWPWFGNKDGAQAHGFARNLVWKFEEHLMPSPSEDVLKFVLETSEISMDYWPFRFKLVLSVSIGKLLALSLTSINMDKVPFDLTQALHTYFKIGNIGAISIQGLEGYEYLDKTDHAAKKLNEGAFVFTKEEDTLFFSKSTVVITDLQMNREIHINKSRSSGETVVWNPGPERSKAMADMADDGYQTMVCVEAANTGEGGVVLYPGDNFTIYQLISVHHV